MNLESNLVERISTEFNQLQFYVTKSKGQPLIEQVKPVSPLVIIAVKYEAVSLALLPSQCSQNITPRQHLQAFLTFLSS